MGHRRSWPENPDIPCITTWKVTKCYIANDVEARFRFFRTFTFSLSAQNHSVEMIKSHTTMRGKQVGRRCARNWFVAFASVTARLDATRRGASPSNLVAGIRSSNWLPSRPILRPMRRTDRSYRAYRIHEGTRLREGRNNRHDPDHHSIESYIRPAFTRWNGWPTSNKLVRGKLVWQNEDVSRMSRSMRENETAKRNYKHTFSSACFPERGANDGSDKSRGLIYVFTRSAAAPMLD